jgi:hypothetical protein
VTLDRLKKYDKILLYCSLVFIKIKKGRKEKKAFLKKRLFFKEN